MEYEAVIGLEVHVHLKTETKIFCSCKVEFGAEPNTNVCPVCMGLPGVLPVLNKEALKKGIIAGLVLNCKIAEFSKFDRKQYFYPDLPKNYQISQYDLPIAYDGYLDITVNGEKKRIRIRRVHLEEDAGKLVHSEVEGINYSYVDFNRAGVPLVEIVSEPDIRTPHEAYEYLRLLRSRLRYAGVSECNMEEGSLRCDANISVRPKGSKELGVKTEIKNMNSFRGVEKALTYEIERQIKVLERGERIVQETRLWDATKGKTFSMRTKEEAHDYRYFPDPDLVPLVIDKNWVEKLKNSLPEFPDEKVERYIKEFKISEYNAKHIAEEQDIALFFEECVKLYNNPKMISNWILSEVLQYLNKQGKRISELTNLTPEKFVELLKLIEKGEVSGLKAKDILPEIIETGKTATHIIEERGLRQVSDTDWLEKLVEETIKEEPEAVKKYKSGKTKILGFFIGKVMQKTKGKANPKILNNLFRKKLEEVEI